MVDIVLDTNVLVSGLMNAATPPGRIVDGLRADEIRLCFDDRIFAEYYEVFTRPELARWIHPTDADAILDHIQHSARRVDGSATIEGLPDPDDAPFAEVARLAAVPLVTGNVRHFPRDIAGAIIVLTPREYLTFQPD